jgi:hypothetical protein
VARHAACELAVRVARRFPLSAPALVKPIGIKLLGRPGYFRFESDFDLTVRLPDEVLKETGRTMHEMVALT